MGEDKKPHKRGVFWIVDDELLAVPYDEDAAEGLSKKGSNYNHRLLWEHVRPKKSNRRFDYYPRGRVEYTAQGKPVIFLGLSVEQKYISEICEAFEITDKPYVRYDGSTHYTSEKEREEKRDKKRKRIKKSRKSGLL